MTTKEMKMFCKYVNNKFVKEHNVGFISSVTSPVKAGMKINLSNGTHDYSSIRVVGKKTSYILNKVYEDGDVQIIGMFTNLEQVESVNK
jgi:uncharacterized protein YgiM (DUF1202 family)